MSQRVDFYVIGNRVVDAKHKFCVRLSQKLLGLKKKIVVVCPDSTSLEKLDELLWSMIDTSFLPHAQIEESNDGSPILLATKANYSLANDADVLINLDKETFLASERIVEIINADEAEISQGREKYRWYKQQGCLIQHHPIEL